MRKNVFIIAIWSPSYMPSTSLLMSMPASTVHKTKNSKINLTLPWSSYHSNRHYSLNLRSLQSHCSLPMWNNLSKYLF